MRSTPEGDRPLGPAGRRDTTRAWLNAGIAVTLTLSLLSNLLRAVLGDGPSWWSMRSGVVLLAVPGVLFLALVVARVALAPVRRLRAGRRTCA